MWIEGIVNGTQVGRERAVVLLVCQFLHLVYSMLYSTWCKCMCMYLIVKFVGLKFHDLWVNHKNGEKIGTPTCYTV